MTELLAWLIPSALIFVATCCMVGYQYLRANDGKKKEKKIWRYIIHKIK